MDVTHDVPDYLRLIVGGHDLDEYPGFNGQFSRPVFRLGQGSFMGSVQDYQ